jgi:hypothetical protein
MNNNSKFSRSWAITKLCWSVLTRNKSLLAFPVLTFVFSILVVVFFIAPVAAVPTGHSLFEREHWEQIGSKFFASERSANGKEVQVWTAQGWVYWVVLYLGSMFVVTFANVAFYHEILAALRGGDASVARGLSFAATKWRSILMWTLLAGAVGIIIRMIEEKLSFVARWIASLLGAAWSVACIFVIPILVESESANPVQALKKSALILTRTWGEAIVGYAGLVLGNLIIFVLSVVIILGCIFVGVWQEMILIPVVIGLAWLAVLFTYAYIMSVLSQIYRGALYLFAAEGATVPGFTADLLTAAWKEKKKK